MITTTHGNRSRLNRKEAIEETFDLIRRSQEETRKQLKIQEDLYHRLHELYANDGEDQEM